VLTQLIDDVLDFVVTADQFGKPVNADLSLGLATAPVLYAAQTYPELLPLMERKFSNEGDVEIVFVLIRHEGLFARAEGSNRHVRLQHRIVKQQLTQFQFCHQVLHIQRLFSLLKLY
jgi:geranylgeranyl pyrophosphate synthase